MENSKIRQIHIQLLNFIESEVVPITLREGENDYVIKADETGTKTLTTPADTLIQEILINKLLSIFPEAGIIAEELTQGHEILKDYNWIIDPIDGTHNFQKRLDMWGTSIALWHKDTPLYAMTYFPKCYDKFFYAIKGLGAFDQHNKKVKLFPSHGFNYTYSIDSYTREFKRGIYNLNYLSEISFKSVGCVLYSSYNMFKGGQEFNILYKQCIWDFAALVLIAKEIGLSVDFITDTKFGSPDFSTLRRTLLIYKPDLPKEFLEKLKLDIQKLCLF